VEAELELVLQPIQRHDYVKKEVMEKNWIILILIVLAFVAFLVFLIIKNQKDRKTLFKRLPGDYPDPADVKSEFDSRENGK
jgi:hypothetical protein